MIFHVNTTSSVPIYAQIVEQVKYAIASGVLRQGDTLPSLREMAGHLRVNPLTVAKAYKELEGVGVTVTEHGRGTFVSASAQRLGDEYRIQALSQAVERMLVEAHLLGASADEVRAMVDEKLQGERETK